MVLWRFATTEPKVIAMAVLTTRQVLAKVPWKRAGLMQNCQRGTFPKPARMGHTLVWDEREVDAWIAARFDEVREKAAA